MTGDHDEFLRDQFLHHQDGHRKVRLGRHRGAAHPERPRRPVRLHRRPDRTSPARTGHRRPGRAIIIAQALLNDLAQRVVDDHTHLTHGQRLPDLIAGYDAVLVDGPITEDLYPGPAIGRYGADRVALRQIVWPDRDGRSPGPRLRLLAASPAAHRPALKRRTPSHRVGARRPSTAESRVIVDESFGTTGQGYRLTRVLHLGEHTVRVDIRYDSYAQHSHVIAEVLSAGRT
jgi:hypothetical protein